MDWAMVAGQVTSAAAFFGGIGYWYLSDFNFAIGGPSEQ